MLTKLIVKNFKSIGEKGIDLELKPLTILVGPNGSGKSSVLEALAILPAQIEQREFRLNGELVQFSAYEEIAHKHELARWITLEIRTLGNDGIRYENKPDSGEAKEVVIRNGAGAFQWILEGNRRQGVKLKAGVYGQGLIEMPGNTLPILYAHKYEDSLIRQELLNIGLWPEIELIIARTAEFLKERVFLLSSLRGKVPPQATTGEFPPWVGVQGQGLIPILSLLHSSLYEGEWSKIQRWAEEFGLLKLKAGLRGVNILAADFVDPELKATINLAFAGQGSRQIISIITQLFWARPDSLIMIEEPEISLHPEAQVKLGELFADAIKEDKQIMVTTHSHFLLLALGQAVQKGLKVDDIVVYHVTKGKEGTTAKPVKLSKRGYPLGWPPSYEKVEKELAFNWAKDLAQE